jgi:hypothetical protein
MKRGIFTLAVMWAVLTGVEGAQAAPGSGNDRREGGARIVGKSSRPATARARRRGGPWSRRTVRVRPAGATLPQVRAELSRLESGLGARLQRIEKVASRPPRPTVVVAPPSPPAPAPEFPLVPAAVGAMVFSLGTGVLGFVLGQAWARRRTSLPCGVSPEEETDPGRRWQGARAKPYWSQLHERLEHTERRLSTARARLHQIERRT